MKLGDELMRRMEPRKGREDAVHLWALSRVGARVPLYGPLNAVVPPREGRGVGRAAARVGLARARQGRVPARAARPAHRRSHARSRRRDARASSRRRVRAMPGGDRAAVLVEQVVALEAREERVALGDTLPAGLRLVIDDEQAE